MLEIIIITVSISIIIILLIFVINLYNKIALTTKEKKELRREITSLENKLQNRKAFRVDLPLENCEFGIVKIGDETADPAKKGHGKIKDLSFGGMKLLTEIELPVRKHVVLALSFELNEKEYELTGIVKRKSESHLNPEIIYGIEFKNINSKNKRTLYQLLNKIEIERKKSQNQSILQDG